ncbi:MAG TPA: LapA family protein [Ignavibacteriaceae bacterium]|nr:LapA family protein [Ignavibacteriaceae bacterium]
MRIKLIIISILFLLSAIIALQNTIEVDLKFLFLTINGPLIVMIIVIFILGLVTGIGVAGAYERKKRLKDKADDKLGKATE